MIWKMPCKLLHILLLPISLTYDHTGKLVVTIAVQRAPSTSDAVLELVCKQCTRGRMRALPHPEVYKILEGSDGSDCEEAVEYIQEIQCPRRTICSYKTKIDGANPFQWQRHWPVQKSGLRGTHICDRGPQFTRVYSKGGYPLTCEAYWETHADDGSLLPTPRRLLHDDGTPVYRDGWYQNGEPIPLHIWLLTNKLEW